MNKLRVLSVLVVLALALAAAGCGGGGGARSVAIDKDVVGITSTLTNFMAAARSGDQATLQSLLASPGESYLIVKDFGKDITNPNDNATYTFYVNPDLISQTSSDQAHVYAYYIQYSGEPLWLYFNMVREDGRWVIEQMLNKAPESGGYVQPVEPVSPPPPSSEFVATSYNPISSDIVKIFSVEDATGRVIPERLILNYGEGYLDSLSGVTLHQLNETYANPTDPDFEGFMPGAASRRSLVGSIAGSIAKSIRRGVRSGRFSLRGQSELVLNVYYGFDSQGAFYFKMEDSSAMVEFNNGLPVKLFEPSHPFGTIRTVVYPYVIDGVSYGSTITLNIGSPKTLVTPLQTYTAVAVTITDVDNDTGEGEKWVEHLAAGIGEVGYDSFETLTSASPIEIERILTRFNSTGSINERNDPVITNTNTYLGSFNVGDPISSVQVNASGGTGPYEFRWYYDGSMTHNLLGVNLSLAGVLQGIAEGSGAGENFTGKVEVVDKYYRHTYKEFSYDSLVGVAPVADSIDFAQSAGAPELYYLFAGVNISSDTVVTGYSLRNDGDGNPLLFQTPPDGLGVPTNDVQVVPLPGLGWSWNSSWVPPHPAGSSPNSLILGVGMTADLYLQTDSRSKFVQIRVRIVDVNMVAPIDRRTGDLSLEVIAFNETFSDPLAVSIR